MLHLHGCLEMSQVYFHIPAIAVEFYQSFFGINLGIQPEPGSLVVGILPDSLVYQPWL